MNALSYNELSEIRGGAQPHGSSGPSQLELESWEEYMKRRLREEWVRFCSGTTVDGEVKFTYTKEDGFNIESTLTIKSAGDAMAGAFLGIGAALDLAVARTIRFVETSAPPIADYTL